MPERILEPFESLRSLAVTAELTDDASFVLLGDLADTDAVGPAGTMLSTLIVPNLKRVLSRRLGAARELDRSIAVDTVDSTLRVAFRLTLDDVRALGEPSELPPGGRDAR